MNTAAASDKSYAFWRDGDFVRFLAGRLVSGFGQQMLTVAIGWELYERTHSALALGFVGLTEVIAIILFTLPAGHLADNHGRKRIIGAAAIVIATSSMGLAMIAWLKAPVAWYYACLCLNLGPNILATASSAFITGLVPRQILSRAIAWNSSTFQLSCILGPAAGGALIAVTHHTTVVFILNSLAALTCFALICFIRKEHVVAYPETMTLSSLLDGFKFVFASRTLMGMITLDVFAVLLGGAVALLPVYAKDILHVGPGGLGLLQAAMPWGSLLRALWLTIHDTTRRRAPSALSPCLGLATVVWIVAMVPDSLRCLFGLADNVVSSSVTCVQLLLDENAGVFRDERPLRRQGIRCAGGLNWPRRALAWARFCCLGGIAQFCGIIIALIWPELRNYGRLDGESDPPK
jgi:MFS family permease